MELPRIRRILCPTDFSQASSHGLGRGIAVARDHGAELVCLYVQEPSPSLSPDLASLPIPPLLGEDDRERLIKEMLAFMDPARRTHVPFSPRVRQGDPAVEILAEAEASAADMIVMGTHGRRGFEKWLLGSVTERVVRESPVPVLTVPPGPNAAWFCAPYRRVLCGVQFPIHQETVSWAVSLAQAARASLTLLHIVEDAPEGSRRPLEGSTDRRGIEADARQQLEALVSKEVERAIEVESLVRFGSADRWILEESGAADLVVVGTHGGGLFARLFFGSTSEHVLRGARCGALTVRSRFGQQARRAS